MGTRNQPRVRNVTIAAALVFLAAVGALVRYEAGYPLSPFGTFGRDTSADGRRELRALRREPVIDFRAPSTRLRSETELPAGTDWWNAQQPTEIRRLFTLSGEPGDAVDAHRAKAEAGGWQLVSTQCSFSLRSTSVTLTRLVAGRPAKLQVYGYLERDPPQSRKRGLAVVLKGEAPATPAEGPADASQRRRNVHCLRDFDPADPSLLPPARLPSNAGEICSLLSLAEAKQVVPALTKVTPSSDGLRSCRYGDVANRGFNVVMADQPRAYYEDRPSDGASVWVDTRIGPVQIYGGSTPERPGLDAGQMARLAALLARR